MTTRPTKPRCRRRIRGAPLAGLAGEPAATPWDPELAIAMRRRDLRVEEELTLDALLQDLSP